MIYGIGTDIVKIERIKNLCNTYNERFIKRILSHGEIDILPKKNSHTFIAGRFAAKEALFKALGGRNNIDFTDIEILNDRSGRPVIKDLNKIGKSIHSLKDAASLKIHISISHEREFAIAFVTIEIL